LALGATSRIVPRCEQAFAMALFCGMKERATIAETPGAYKVVAVGAP
jgi:hypothetical protein